MANKGIVRRYPIDSEECGQILRALENLAICFLKKRDEYLGREDLQYNEYLVLAALIEGG